MPGSNVSGADTNNVELSLLITRVDPKLEFAVKLSTLNVELNLQSVIVNSIIPIGKLSGGHARQVFAAVFALQRIGAHQLAVLAREERLAAGYLVRPGWSAGGLARRRGGGDDKVAVAGVRALLAVEEVELELLLVVLAVLEVELDEDVVEAVEDVLVELELVVLLVVEVVAEV